MRVFLSFVYSDNTSSMWDPVLESLKGEINVFTL